MTPSSAPKQLTFSIVVSKSGFSPANTSAVSRPREHPFASVTSTV